MINSLSTKPAQSAEIITEQSAIPSKLEGKMRILANFLIDRILEDTKNDKLKLVSKEN